MTTTVTCTVDHCDKPHYSKALCKKHYDMQRRRGTTAPPTKAPKSPCSVDGCEKVSYAKGVCANHYQKVLRYGTPTPTPEMKKKPGPAPNPDAPRSRHGDARKNEGNGRTYDHLEIGGTCKNGHVLTENNTHTNRHGGVACSVCRVNAFRRNVGRPEVDELQVANVNKVFCKNGHAFTPENTYIKPNGDRGCFICRTESSLNSNMKKYGLTGDDKRRMVEEQGGLCKICRQPFKDARDTHVDHFHDDGRVRGILCGSCNMGIGMFKDSPERLLAAAQYLLDADAFRLSTDSPTSANKTG